MDRDVGRSAEDYVAALQETITGPHDRECLACYVSRMLNEHGCDNTLRWSERWQHSCASRATTLADRLARRGGYCDCEVLLNVYPERLLDDGEEVPVCRGVSRRGSTKPCPLPTRRQCHWSE